MGLFFTKNKSKYRSLECFPFASSSKQCLSNHFPSISIVLPVYNHAKYIESAVLSVLEMCSFDYELIIINDGSTDSTAEKLERFKSYHQIKIIHQSNVGLALTLNRGFKEASCDLVTWTSADNIYSKDSLRLMAQYLMNNPSVDIVYSNVQLIDENGRPARNSSYRKQDQSLIDSSVLLLPIDTSTLSELNDNFINACFLMRRSICIQTGAHIKDKLGYEDYDFWLRASLLGRIAHIDTEEPLYKYRIHTDSLTSELGISSIALKQTECFSSCRKRKKLISTPLSFVLYINKFCNIQDSVRCLSQLVEYNNYRCEVIEDSFDETPKCHAVIEIKIDDHSQLAQKKFYLRFLEFNSFSAFFTELLKPIELSLTSEFRDTLNPLILLPPLKFNAALKRCRDTNFQAIEADSLSNFTALVLLSDIEHLEDEIKTVVLGRLSSIIYSNSEVTFVLYTSNKPQRNLADKINLSLKNNSNLRIIDASEPPAQSYISPESPALEPLLFSLSSSDVLITPYLHTDSVSSLLTHRNYSALASVAGIPLLTIQSEVNVEHQTSDNITKLIRSIVSQSPNSWYLSSSGSKSTAFLSFPQQDDRCFSEICRAATNNYNLFAAEQFLDTLTEASYVRRLSALFFSHFLD